ncbi:agrin-like, partial [Diadema antillarum]|uniref:agrin-like n=1 Tax=Diadema antillarum TaxID=105358 RepID=UPI003A850FCE
MTMSRSCGAALLAAIACVMVAAQLRGAAAVQINNGVRTCQEHPVEIREEMANVVISGFIQGIMRKPRTIMYDCNVEVFRVFKGRNELHSHVEPPMNGNSLMIGGFGDPTICDNAVTRGETRIFMLNKNNDGHLMLNSSVIRITLNNLVEAEAAVLGIAGEEECTHLANNDVSVDLMEGEGEREWGSLRGRVGEKKMNQG